MADVKLKFYGRFVQAHHGATVSFIAPRFDAPYSGHEIFMTIRHDQVKFFEPDMGADRQQLTTCSPRHRIASYESLHNPEMLVWDLSRCLVSFDVFKPVTVAFRGDRDEVGRGDVVGLDTLEAIQGRVATLSHTALTPGDGSTNAVIAVTAGTGTAIAPVDAKVQFFSNPGTPDAAPALKDDRLFTIVPAEVMEFDITLDGQRSEDANDAPFLRLAITKAGVTSHVTVKRGATVVFTNLCAELHEPAHIDLEFAQYYNLLAAPPAADALIPVETGTTSEGMRCYMQARVD